MRLYFFYSSSNQFDDNPNNRRWFFTKGNKRLFSQAAQHQQQQRPYMPAYMQPAAGASPGAARDPFRPPGLDSANGYHQGAGGDSSSWAMADSISQSSGSRLRDR